MNEGTEIMLGIAVLLVGLGLFISMMSASGYAQQDAHAYHDCVKQCGAKHFTGYAIGEDIGSKQGSGESFKYKIYNPTVQEYDRAPCMRDCNTMFLKLRGKE